MPKQVISFRNSGSAEQQSVWDEVEQNALFQCGQLGLGVVLNTNTGYWQTWLSLYGGDLSQISAHEKEDDANEALDTLRQALIDLFEGRIEDITPRIGQIIASGDAVAQLLPDEVVLQITSAMHAVYVQATTPRRLDD